MFKKLLTSALLLAGIIAEQAAVEEAKAAEGWATYAPLRTESFVIDNFQLGQTGIVLGGAAGQWSVLTGGGNLWGNHVSALTGTPFVLLSNQGYTLPGYGDWQLMGGVNFASQYLSGTINSAYGPNQDPFYGQGYFGGVELTSGWNLGFALTNQKVYAIYSYLPVTQSILNNYYSFTYYVPIAQRNAIDVDTLSLVINKKESKISYRANGFELLLITQPGLPIADKFKIGDYGGLTANVTLPTSLQIAIGVMEPQEPASPHPVCQQTLFQACAESINCAYKTLCQYASVQNPVTYPYSFNLTATYAFISVVEQSPVLTCYDHAKCPQYESSCSCASSHGCCAPETIWPSTSSCDPCHCCYSSSSSSSCCNPCGCSSSSSSSCGCPPSSSSSCGCPSSSSSDCGCSSSSSSGCGCPSSSSSSACGCSSNSTACDGFIPPNRHCSSSSSSSQHCREPTECCVARRNDLRRQGFIFPL